MFRAKGGSIIEAVIEKIYKLDGIYKLEYESNEVTITENDNSVIELEVIIEKGTYLFG